MQQRGEVLCGTTGQLLLQHAHTNLSFAVFAVTLLSFCPAGHFPYVPCEL
jgi:hypothetical protein